MESQMNFSEYTIQQPTQGTKAYFSSHPMKEWQFYDYFFFSEYKNKLKHFNRIVSEYTVDMNWILSQEGIPEQVKHYCRFLLKDIPVKAKFKAESSRPIKKRKININYGTQLIFGGSGATIVVSSQEKKEGQDKEGQDKEGQDKEGQDKEGQDKEGQDKEEQDKEEHDKEEQDKEEHDKEEQKKEEAEEVDEADGFWKRWIEFLKNKENFHPYSPENHNIIRCGKGVSHRPNLDLNIYRAHLESHKDNILKIPDVYVPYIDGVFSSELFPQYKKAIRNIPDCDGHEECDYDFLEGIFRGIYKFHTTNQDMKDGESTFNSLFVCPFLEVVAEYLKNSEDWCKAGFCCGERSLQAMKEQLDDLPIYQDDSHTYLADGIIKLFGQKTLELLLLETSGPFQNKDKSKIAFDHHKGLFGALAMLKAIADSFSKARIETFENVKVFFLHAAGESLYLWSLRFEQKAQIYELWLEDMLLIKPNFEDKLEALSGFLRFFWAMKCLLRESIQNISQLKKEHARFLYSNRFSSDCSSSSLASIVDPSILKLTEEDDKTGMHLLGPFFNK